MDKAHRLEDLTIKTEMSNERWVRIPSLRLRMPKTMRILAEQIVKIPETDLYNQRTFSFFSGLVVYLVC